MKKNVPEINTVLPTFLIGDRILFQSHIPGNEGIMWFIQLITQALYIGLFIDNSRFWNMNKIHAVIEFTMVQSDI